MAINLYTEAYSDLVDEAVLKRFAVLDNILSSDQLLVGLSDQGDLDNVNKKYNVVSDLVLGMDFYGSQKKPRKYKGEFSNFSNTISDIDYIATCIGYGTSEYHDRDKKDREAKERFNVQDELQSIVRSQAEKLGLADSWSMRTALTKRKSADNPDALIKQLVNMVFSYYFYLVGFAHVADFDDVSLCALFIEQMEAGGIPCGWLSKSPYWDLSKLESYSDHEKGDYPKLHHGVFADPTDKLAMLYLD